MGTHNEEPRLGRLFTNTAVNKYNNL